MKTLNQDCPKISHICFIVLAFLQPQYKPYIRKPAHWFLLVFLFTTTRKHCEKHDLIFYFHFYVDKNRSLNM